jgi:hypothetical protein
MNRLFPAWLCASFLTTAAGLVPVSLLSAAELNCSSGPAQVSLIELYTSEGCSSCPPADHWLEALRFRPRLWLDFVPVGFHVNYWDNLGWKDRFATRAFTQRQYALAKQWGTNSVYTPCFTRDGQEWHPGGDLLPSSTRAAAGILSVHVTPDGQCQIHYQPAAGPGQKWEAHLALLGGGYASHVDSGENRGETLRHEFVALAVTDAALRPTPDGVDARVPCPVNTVPGAVRQGLAVWITRAGSLAPVQATGGWLE